MSYAQRVRYAEDNIVRVRHSTVNEIWSPDVIDLDGMVLGVVRSPVGGDDCTRGCDPDNCWCSCDYTALFEVPVNVGGWELEELTCQCCGSQLHVVEVVGTWGDVKDDL